MILETLEVLSAATNESYAKLDAERAGLYEKLHALDEKRKEMQAELSYLKESMARVGKAYEALTSKVLKSMDEPDDEVERHGPYPVESLSEPFASTTAEQLRNLLEKAEMVEEEEKVTSFDGLR